MDTLRVEIRARLGWVEAEAVHQIDVGLGAMALVVLVGDGSDLLQAEITPELGLSLEDGLHDCRRTSCRAMVFKWTSRVCNVV